MHLLPIISIMDIKYSFKETQAELQNYWHDQQIYKLSPKSIAQSETNKLFSIDTPPPTISGSLHIGHIFSYTQTDILARFARLNGLNVLYPFGFDDNGLATERFVENSRDVKAYQLPRAEFIALCLEETQKAQVAFKQLWQQLGLSVDWDVSYSTISPLAQKLSQQSFIELYRKNFIYKKAEPALYCTGCRTSVAQAELDDKEVPAIFYTIAFKDEKDQNLLIATTRPELLSSCVALFYNPEDSRYEHLKGQKAIVPYYGNLVPILADSLVIKEKGTGLVMCCTFGDKTDIEWFKKYSLPYKQSIGIDGKWTEQTRALAGLSAFHARAAMVNILKEQDLVREEKPITHTVNIHERCQKEIEYIILSQWFIHILKYKQEFLDYADKIEWYPEFMKSRYTNWVENLGWDWGISRQRFYGIPFPVWHCTNCEKILLAPLEALPIDPQVTEYPGKSCPDCNSTNIKPDTDVMDTWNTSSITPYIVSYLLNSTANPFANNNHFIPMSMRPQAHDIIRTWAFYTIVKSWMHNNKIPWKKIVISGHVLSSAKEKLSKSKSNNPLAPENLLQMYSADAIRYWTASGRLGTDITFSDSQIKIGERLVTKLWNAFKFIELHILNPLTTHPGKNKDLGIVNEWIMDHLSKCFEKYKNYFTQQEFSLALNAIEQFFWHDFCDNYIELVKHQLFNPDLYDNSLIDATRTTLSTVGLAILQLYAPFLPYITEKLYKELYKTDKTPLSIHTTLYSQIQQQSNFSKSSQEMSQLIDLIGMVRKIKTQAQLSLKTQLTELIIVNANTDLRSIITQNLVLLKTITQAINIQITAHPVQEKQLIKNDIDTYYLQITLP